MKLIFILLSTTFSLKIYSQDCDCLSQFKYIKNYFENNSPAYQKIITDKKSLKNYLGHVKKITAEISLKSTLETCPTYFDKYIALLKDHHSGIGYNLKRLDFSKDSLIQNFKNSIEYKNFTIINIDTIALQKRLSQKKKSEIEGIYTNGVNIEFGVYKKEHSKNEFIGVVLKKSRFLEIGHLIMEIKHIKNNIYDCTYNVGLLGFNFLKIYKRINVVNGQMEYFGFSKIVNHEENLYEFKALDNKTNYLRLSSFDGSITNELDSFYKSIDKQIKHTPYLIIDLRDNSGGSEQSYFNIMPYIYTNPMKVDSVLVWVTPDNIRHYENSLNLNNPKLTDRMKVADPYSFIPQVEKATSLWTMDSTTVFPEKVIVIYNNRTASAAEAMISYCMQSSKVVTIGENSGGFMGYGDVMVAETPCEMFTLRCSTTKYHSNSKYEFVGIKPTYKITGKKIG